MVMLWNEQYDNIFDIFQVDIICCLLMPVLSALSILSCLSEGKSVANELQFTNSSATSDITSSDAAAA